MASSLSTPGAPRWGSWSTTSRLGHHCQVSGVQQSSSFIASTSFQHLYTCISFVCYLGPYLPSWIPSFPLLPSSPPPLILPPYPSPPFSLLFPFPSCSPSPADAVIQAGPEFWPMEVYGRVATRPTCSSLTQVRSTACVMLQPDAGTEHCLCHSVLALATMCCKEPY